MPPMDARRAGRGRLPGDRRMEETVPVAIGAPPAPARPSAADRVDVRAGAALAAALGAALLFATGFAGPDLLHDAAHDARHVFTFPCH